MKRFKDLLSDETGLLTPKPVSFTASSHRQEKEKKEKEIPVTEQHREEGRFKPTIPRMVKSKGVGPRPTVDSAKVKLKEDFGKQTPPVEEVAKKHGVSVDEINKQLEMGIKVEKEHTSDPKMAREIALDHLNEKPNYYSKLKKYVEMTDMEYQSAGSGARTLVDKPNKEPMKTYKNFLKKEEVEQLDEISAQTKASYKEKAQKTIKELEPHAKSGEYKSIAQNIIARRKAGLAKMNEGENKQMKGKDPCWKGYEMIGKKMKNGKEVPNCVPVKEAKDDVGEMIKDKLKIIINRAQEMHDHIDSKSDMPEWVKSKITLAQDYVSTACDYSCGKEQLGEETEQLNEINEKQIKRDIDSGMSHDAVIGKHANKRTTNTDQIRKIIQKHMWDKRMKKESVEEPPIHVRSMYTRHYAKHGGTISKAKEASAKAYDAVEKMHGKEMRNKLEAFHRRNMNEEVEQLEEGRPSQRHPLEGHEYHKKSNDELIRIAKDAHKAAEAMKSHNTQAENKYRDQANDSATVRYFRQKSGMPDWYKKKYGHVKEEVEQIDEMDKSQPSSDRGGESSGNPWEKGGKATPITAKKAKTNFLSVLNKSIDKANKAKQDTATKMAKHKMKEEVEQIDEVSDTTLSSYTQKAKKSADELESQKQHGKALKRRVGVLSAVSKMTGRAGEKIGQLAKEETDKAPFEGGTTKQKEKVIPGKLGKGYSTARHLARQALKKQVEKMKPMKESLSESRKAEIVKEIVKKKKNEENSEKFQADPEFSSEITKA